MPIEFLNPVGECVTPVNDYHLCAPANTALTVGLVINRIVDCDTFMHEVGEALIALDSGLTVNYYETGEITFADAGLMDRVALECGAAVCAIGHCGSCTAGTIKDGIALIERGLPAVSLVTELFWEQGSALARSLGWPDAPRTQLPYPIWGSGEIAMRAVAARIAPGILRQLGRAAPHD